MRFYRFLPKVYPPSVWRPVFGKGKEAGETPQRRWRINRYAGFGNQEIGTLFRGIHYSAVSKSSERLETKMTKDKDLRNLVKEILSNVKT